MLRQNRKIVLIAMLAAAALVAVPVLIRSAE